MRRFIRYAAFFAIAAGIVSLALPIAAGWNPFRPALRMDASLLRDGDIIFIRGATVRGMAVALAEKSSPYSHTGIIHKEGGSTWVIHATPSGDSDYVCRDSLDDFLAISGTRHAAVCRALPEFSDIAVRAAKRAEFYYSEKYPFDGKFSLKSEDSLYCTELVWRAYLDAGLDLSEGRRDDVSFPLIDEPVLLPSSLLRSKYLSVVANEGL